MIPKPIKWNGLKNFIKQLFNREYELTSNLNWHDSNGECIRALMLAYHQVNAEEETRIQKEMDSKNTSKN